MSETSEPIDALAVPKYSAPTIPTAPPVADLVRAAVIIVTVFIGGGLAWASLAPLASAAIAPGVVRVENSRKTVQHLEGGIIREILVREGDVVAQNQPLLRLDDREAEADRGTLRGQIDALAAREARLIAQLDGVDEIVFPQELLQRRTLAAVEQITSGQARIFSDQKRALDGEIDILLRRIDQHRAQIATIRSQIRVTREQLPKLEEELRDVRTLFSKGLGLKPRVLDLERRVMAAKGDIAGNDSRIVSLEEQIRESEAQIEAARRKNTRSVSEELREVQTALMEARESFSKAEARAGRREVLAPQEGVVMNLKYTTPGGVVPPGGVILDLVPREEKLVTEARISPLDIDVVRPDLPARIRLVAYKQRNTPVLEGRVGRVAPDAVIDEKTGTTHFVAVIEVDVGQLARASGVRLYPGMPVEVSIVTGHRRLLDYMVQPLTDSMSRAFRED